MSAKPVRSLSPLWVRQPRMAAGTSTRSSSVGQVGVYLLPVWALSSISGGSRTSSSCHLNGTSYQSATSRRVRWSHWLVAIILLPSVVDRAERRRDPSYSSSKSMPNWSQNSSLSLSPTTSPRERLSSSYAFACIVQTFPWSARGVTSSRSASRSRISAAAARVYETTSTSRKSTASSSSNSSTRSRRAVVFPLPGPPNRRTTSVVESVIANILAGRPNKQRALEKRL